MYRAVIVALGFLLLAASGRDVDAPYEVPQQLVDVGHHRLNLYCTGSGSPAVILDAAIGSSTYVWHLVQPALAQHVRVCSYDRAGYGFSEPSRAPHTTAVNVAELHKLLSAAHIAPPYVIAAHSLNAFDARLYADRYRQEVAGLVLIDPSETDEDRFAAIDGKKHLDEEQKANLEYVQLCDRKAHHHALKAGDDCVGPPHRDQSPAFQRVELQHTTSPAMWDAVLSEMANARADAQEVAQAQRPYGKLPLIVLTAGAADQIAADTRLWKQMRERDAAFSRLGVSCVVPGSGHYIQLEKPQAVIAAILNAVYAGKTASKPRC